MDFTKEQIQKAMTASSAEELFAMAKEDGIELTLSEAEEYYSQLHENFEMTDDDLQMVAGGKGTPPVPTPRYKVGQRVRIHPELLVYSYLGTVTDMRYDYLNQNWHYDIKIDRDGSVFSNAPLELMVDRGEIELVW